MMLGNRSLQFFFMLLFLFVSLDVQARVEVLEFKTPEHEDRYQKLINELRCMVCQNQNLADSNAEVAQDLRKKTHQLVEEDQSEQQIIDYMVARYGEFVLYRPPFKSSTIFLWVGPFVILLIAVYLMLRTIRSRRRLADESSQVSEDELKLADKLLNEEDTRP